MPTNLSRRGFIRKSAGIALAGSLAAETVQATILKPIQKKNVSPGDTIGIGVIGMGIMGFSNTRTALEVPGVKLVAVCDLYSGRLERAKEIFGKDIYTTKNYKEILDRKDIDAVIIATSDHWHDRISIEAMNKGKHVYCEKPMVHKLEEGAEVIATQKRTGVVFQVGSQRVSSITTLKAKELYKSGDIGDLVLVETWMDRQGANGAWQYSIPTDAKNNTVDWENFQGDAPKMPYDPVRFFRWRNYNDYGTGIAGDLFVHLFSGLHTVIQSQGPESIYASGGLRFWKDGRDAPDLITGICDYPKTSTHPAFNLQLRVNFCDGSGGGEGLRLVGTHGVITLGWGSVKILRNRTSLEPGYGGWDSYDTFSAAQQKEYATWYNSTHPKTAQMKEKEQVFNAPEGYSEHLDHHQLFFDAIRKKATIVEDALFGMQAAGPALACNMSLASKKIIYWDPVNAVRKG